MKTLSLTLVCLFFALLPSSCSFTEEQTCFYVEYIPVLVERQELEQSVSFLARPQPIKNPGKIYFKDGYLFLNEKMKGIHLLDNRNPSAPINLGFLRVPGSIDMATQGNFLYVDNAVDLITFDISELRKPKLLSRNKNVFPELKSPAGFVPWAFHRQNRPKNTIIIGWEGKLVACPKPGLYPSPQLKHISTHKSTATGLGSAGKGGSTARFAIAQGHLYTVDHHSLHIFSLHNSAKPNQIARVNTGSGDIETIFPRGRQLFIGSRSGMYIYGLDNPSQPQKIGFLRHVESCDPVVADEKYAYVTLRAAENFCRRGVNRLDIIDITDLSKPQLKKTYTMKSPKGVGIQDKMLYVCDEGVKIYDASEPESLKLKQHFRIEAEDVIPLEGHLIVTGTNGLYQYRLEGQELKLLSRILVNANPN